MEPNYQIKRLSVAAMMRRRASPAEARLIRRDLESVYGSPSAIFQQATPIVDPLWLMDGRGSGSGGTRGFRPPAPEHRI